MAESKDELQSFLMKVKDESEKADLKLNIQKMKIMASGPITSWQIDGEIMETSKDFIFLAPKSLQMVTGAMKLKVACSLEEKLWQTRQRIKKKKHHFAETGLPSQSCFSRSHVRLWELDHIRLSTKELMLSNCGAGEDSWESLGLQEDQTNLS